MERQERITDTNQAVRFVIENAVNDELHILAPRQVSSERWQCNLEIMLRFLLTTQTGQMIGQPFGLTTTERVRQIATRTFFTLWERSLADVRESIDPRAFSKLKQGTRLAAQQSSQALGGVSLKIIQAAQSGASFSDLREGGYSTHQIYRAHRFSKRWGNADISHLDPSRSRKLAEKLANPQSEEQPQALLDQIDHSFLSFHRRHNLNVISPFNHFLTGLNLSGNVRKKAKVAEQLRLSGIPTAAVRQELSNGSTPTYYIILSRDNPRAEQAILENSQLLKELEHPVKQLAGPKLTSLPRTTLLAKRSGYLSFGAVVEDAGIHMPRRVVRQLLADDCPVVLEWKGGLFVAVDQAKALQEYAQSKVAQ